MMPAISRARLEDRDDALDQRDSLLLVRCGKMRERTAGRFDGQVHVGAGPAADRTDHILCGGVLDLNPIGYRRPHPIAVDVKFRSIEHPRWSLVAELRDAPPKPVMS